MSMALLKQKKIIALALLCGASYALYRQQNNLTGLIQSDLQINPMDNANGITTTISNEANIIMDSVKTGFINVPNAVKNSNVQAFLRVIRKGEGTADQGGYSRLFGGQQFSSFADHPRIKVTRGNLTSSAAGAYQFLANTWDEMRASYNLPDFSPASQDIACVGLIKRRGALADVIAGRFAVAVKKCALEWASLPGSPYGQPTQSMASVNQVLAMNGAAEGVAA
jgi:muramidase (phage lysozyme)